MKVIDRPSSHKGGGGGGGGGGGMRGGLAGLKQAPVKVNTRAIVLRFQNVGRKAPFGRFIL